jgi:hypothetical protein
VSDYICSDDGTQLAWIENDEVFSLATRQKVAIRRGRELFSLQGEPLKLHLQDAGLVCGERDSSPAAFLKLLAG